MSNTNVLIQVALRHPSADVREVAVHLTSDVGDLLRLVYTDKSLQVRGAALEQLARLSDRVGEETCADLLRLAETEYETLYPQTSNAHGRKVCPDCGSPLDAALFGFFCPTCGREEVYDFSLPHRDWLCSRFAQGWEQSDLAERVVLQQGCSALLEQCWEWLTEPDSAAFIKSRHERMHIISELDDPDILTHVARHDSDWQVRAVAVRGVDDREALRDIAQCDAHKLVRLAATQRIDSVNSRAHERHS